jgi:hypothetical protein
MEFQAQREQPAKANTIASTLQTPVLKMRKLYHWHFSSTESANENLVYLRKWDNEAALANAGA